MGVYEFNPEGVNIIGYNTPIRFYNPSRALKQEIYLQTNDTLNIGNAPPSTGTGDDPPSFTESEANGLYVRLDGKNWAQWLGSAGVQNLNGKFALNDQLTITGTTPEITLIETDGTTQYIIANDDKLILGSSLGKYHLTVEAGMSKFMSVQGDAHFGWVKTLIPGDYSIYFFGQPTGGYKVLGQFDTTGYFGVGDITPTYKFSVGSADDSNQISMYHDNDNGQFRVDDGSFIFLTDEGTNTDTVLLVLGKGTGRGKIALQQVDFNEYISSLANGYLDIYATTSVRMESAQMSLSGIGALRLGPDTTYEAFYSDAGDVYSGSGKMYIGAGINTVAERYGVGLQIRETALTKTLVYDIDATFTAATATIEKALETFVGDGVVPGDFLVITNANDTSYIGSTGEIVAVTQTTIVVSLAAAGAAVPDDLTDVDFVVYNHPLVAMLDNGDTHFLVGVSPDASFKVHAEDANNEHAIHFDVMAGVNGHNAIELDLDAHTYSGVSGMRMDYDATAFAAGVIGTGLDVVVNNVGASGGDLHGIDIAVSDPTNTDMETVALGTHAGVEVIHQHLGTPATLTKAYKTDATGTINDTSFAFVNSNPDTITDSNNGFVAAGFVAGQVITVSGTDLNDGTYTIAVVVVGTLTLSGNDELAVEAAGDDVTIQSTFLNVTTAFGAAGTDVEIFSNDNDVILLAGTAVWDEINVLLEIPASHTIIPTFEFIEDDGDWIVFVPADDSDGFSQNGTIRFDSDNLATWGQRTLNEVTGEVGAVDYYWQRITRTRNVLPTPPTEDTIEITTLSSLHEWDSVGRLAIKTYSQATEPDATDLPATKFCFWTDTDDAKLYLCYNHGGVIKTVEMT